jgi:NADH dehydrogenase
VRFERGETTFDGAVANTALLFAAAKHAGVRRIVHISVANPDLSSPFPYFRGKARTEGALRAVGLSYAVVRPTLVFGAEDILVNNIAWGLRHVPVFLVPGNGRYEVQPVSVRDTARICVEAGARRDDVTVDAAGPERWTYEDFVRLVARAIGARTWILRSSTSAALAAAHVAGMLLRDVVITRDELLALQSGLLVSHEPPLGSERFEPWLADNADTLGRRYVSELTRNFRG